MEELGENNISNTTLDIKVGKIDDPLNITS
jgi:hypothetical protein